ncbi:MAG: rod shape-determining protein MreD [Oscillospiraceae bacterium]|nr:rod shape-determining protein MreD [Oscillospiraceae bacterium]
MSNRQKQHRQRRTGSEQRTLRRNRVRKILSLLILLLCAVPMLGGGTHALWVIPAAICICMNEDLYFCMAAGVIAGFCIDLACGNALGTNAIYMVCFCTLVCLLFEQILRRTFLHYMVLTAACAFLHSILRWVLTAGIFRTPGRELLWTDLLIPVSLRTVLAAVPVYLLFLPLSRLLTKQVRSMDAAAIRRDL